MIFGLLLMNSVFASHNQKGPFWSIPEEKLPIEQKELLAPYAAHNSFFKQVNQISSFFFETYYSTSSFRAFQQKDLHRIPLHENSFPFVNSSKDIENLAIRNFGFCLGFTVVLRKFNMLATFRPDLPSLDLISYREAIDAIANNKPQIIPGFANLHEFSSDEEIGSYIKKHIIDQWALKNVTLDGIGVFTTTLNQFNKRKARLLYRKLQKALSRGYNPIIYVSGSHSNEERILSKVVAEYCKIKPNDCDAMKEEIEQMKKEQGFFKKTFSHMGQIHVIQAYELSPLDAEGNYQIKAWDINKPAEEAILSIEVSGQGEAPFFIGPAKMNMGDEQMEITVRFEFADIDILPGDKAEIGEMLYNLQ